MKFAVVLVAFLCSLVLLDVSNILYQLLSPTVPHHGILGQGVFGAVSLGIFIMMCATVFVSVALFGKQIYTRKGKGWGKVVLIVLGLYSAGFLGGTLMSMHRATNNLPASLDPPAIACAKIGVLHTV